MLDLAKVEKLQELLTAGINDKLSEYCQLTGEKIVPKEFFAAVLMIADNARQVIMDGDKNPLSLVHEVNKTVWDITLARLNACGKLKVDE